MEKKFEREYAYRTFGAFLSLSFCLMILAVISFAAAKSEAYYLAVGPALLLLLLFRWFLRILSGQKIKLSVSTDGITYGSRLFPWSDIKKVYPYGGKNIRLQEEYILTIELHNSKIQRTHKFPVTKRYSKEEWRELASWMKEFVVPTQQHLEIIER